MKKSQHSWQPTGQSQINPDEEPQSVQQLHLRQQGNQYYAIAAFVLILAAVVVSKIYLQYSQEAKDAQFYRKQLMSFELIDFWKLTAEQLQEEQANPNKKLIDKAEHNITRQELGRNSWTLLHMITGGFPENIPPSLVKKFNIFLVLFGQMYPCKLCANHFMELLKKEGLFTGSTKIELMQYLCEIHNKVNKRLGHPIHNCENVYTEWNTCGCSEETL